MIDPTRFYGVLELRRESHAPRALIYEALKSGALPAIRRGRRWLIPGRAALEWIANGGAP